MANEYDDTEIDAFVAGLQSQINLKAASTELSDTSSIHTTTTTNLTNRVATLEAYVGQLQSMVATLSAQVSGLS